MRKPERIRLWRLKDENVKKLRDQIKETNKKADSRQDFGNNLLVAARKVCGISKNHVVVKRRGEGGNQKEKNFIQIVAEKERPAIKRYIFGHEKNT